MENPAYPFGTKGIWHKPESEDSKARDIPAVVLEQTPEGVLYIFTTEPIVKGSKNLTYRTATIFPSDFTAAAGTQEDLFKVILGELIDLKYENMSDQQILRTGIGALNSFAKQYSISWHSELPCQTCGGTGKVSVPEQVYAGEPHMADVGTANCPECRPPKEEEYDDQG